MKRLPILVGSAFVVFGLLWPTLATAASSPALEKLLADPPIRMRTTDASPEVFNSSSDGLARAVLDTVYLLGGPDTVTGKFQTMLGPGGAPDPQGWIGVDRTEIFTYWKISTFNAENFQGSGATNQAIWSGMPSGTANFATPPGYGNDWDDQLVFTEDINPGIVNEARLRFQFHYDTEPTYDFFFVDWDSSGTWTNLGTYDGTNDDGSGDFLVPAVFDTTILVPKTAGGENGDELRFRLRFFSDGAASDEDGRWDTNGAVQIDNVVVTLNGTEISNADFEGGPDDADWVVVKVPFAGDFSRIFSQFLEFDPCRTNLTPQYGFIDTGLSPNNAPGETTGGSTSPNVDYGVPGAFVVNYTGGISGDTPLWDTVWSPELLWDLPGTDDDAAQGGVFFRTSVWEHLPVLNGMFWIWQVRSFPDEFGVWTPWQFRGGVFFEDLELYKIVRFDVGDLVVQSPDKIQLSLGVIDLVDVFQLPGGDSSPAPLFDNVSIARYRVTGPTITSQRVNRFNDSFSQSGTVWEPGVDKTTLSIRLDEARDILRTGGSSIVAGDSTVIQATAVVPGTALDGPPVLKWVLDANPFFDDVRDVPLDATLLGTFTGRDGRTWDRWQGEVLGIQPENAAGPIEDTYFFDLPDGTGRANPISEPDEPAMFYPGDVLRYFYEATDTDGNVTTAPGGLDDPANLAAFQTGDWGVVGRAFTVFGLPSLLDADDDGTPEQPSILYVNDFGRRGSEQYFLTGFGQNGLFEGIDYDTYTTQRPDSGLSNGIGSVGAHGANPDQLRGYDTIFYDAGDLPIALSDGTSTEDKSQDVQILSQWKTLPGPRNTVHMGDYIADALADGNADALAYLQNTMGVEYVSVDVRPNIDNQTAAIVMPTGDVPGVFDVSFVAYGGCLGINEFDYIRPIATADASHEFLTPDGLGGVYDAAAIIWHERLIDGDRKVDVTMPYGLSFMQTQNPARAPEGSSVLAKFIEELLVGFNKPFDDSDATDTTPPYKPSALLGSKPNPFNPTTQIELRMGVPGTYTLRIYNVRGELVRTLLDELAQPGDRTIPWNGCDDDGGAVGSGVYLTKFVGPDIDSSKKIVLIK